MLLERVEEGRNARSHHLLGHVCEVVNDSPDQKVAYQRKFSSCTPEQLEHA